MKYIECRIPDVKLFEPERIFDERGWMMECYHADDLCFFGVRENFVQENHAYTRLAGTIRGLHFQMPPCAQTKLVRCTSGRSLHAAVDIRPSSATFGQWVLEELSAGDGRLLYIPKGFAHGYLTKTDHTEVQWRLDMPFIPKAAKSLYYADPALNIPWGIEDPILSEKDSRKKALSWQRLKRIL